MTKKKKEIKLEPKYKVGISVNGETFFYEADDLLTILQGFIPPPAIKTEILFTASAKDKTVEYIVSVPHARRMFNNHVALELAASNLTKRLDG